MKPRHLWNGLSLGWATAAHSIGAAAVLPFSSGPGLTAVARNWGRTVSRLCGVELRIEGHEQALDAPAYLVMCNHCSHFDVISVFGSLPIDMRPVAKRELAKIPIFGWVLSAGAAIMIDRGDREKAKASIERAGATIRAGRSVLMFPEGTRTESLELGPLKKGPFYLAVEARVPILPIVVIGTSEVLKPDDWKIEGGTVSLRVGTPIETAGVRDDEAGRDELRMKVTAAMQELLQKGHISK